MAKDELPSRRRVRRQRLLHPLPVLRVFVEPLAAEEVFLRRVDADEFHVAAVLETVEGAGIPRTRRFVIADARMHGNAVDDVAIRLEEREEPVIVLVAGSAKRDAEDA